MKVLLLMIVLLIVGAELLVLLRPQRRPTPQVSAGESSGPSPALPIEFFTESSHSQTSVDTPTTALSIPDDKLYIAEIDAGKEGGVPVDLKKPGKGVWRLDEFTLREETLRFKEKQEESF